MSGVPWISVFRSKSRTVIQEHKAALALISPQQRPLHVAFVGGGKKAEAIKRLLLPSEEHRKPGLHGEIRVWLQPNGRMPDEPLIIFDCELHNLCSSQATPAVYDGPLQDRRLCEHDRFGSKNLESRQRHLGLSLYGTVLAPTVGAMFFFESDFESLRDTARAIAEICRSSSPPDLPAAARPRIVVVRQQEVESSEDIAELVIDEIARHKPPCDAGAARSLLYDFFDSVVTLSSTVHFPACTDVLGQRMNPALNAALNARRRTRVMFTSEQHQAMLGVLLDSFANDAGQPVALLDMVRRSPFPAAAFAANMSDLLDNTLSSSYMHGWVATLLASAAVLDSCPPGAHYFEPSLVFAHFYLNGINAALRGPDRLSSDHTRFVHDVQAEFERRYLAVETGAAATVMHAHHLADIQDKLKTVKSNTVCLCCLMRMPEKVLSCGHALCDICIRTYGSCAPSEKNAFILRVCLLCGDALGEQGSTFRFIPPTASIRGLGIEGGGVRGILPLAFLQCLEKMVRPFDIDLRDVFDFGCGTSSGGLIVLATLIKGWSLDSCLEKFESLSHQIFQRRFSFNMPFSKIQDLVLSYLMDSKYRSNNITTVFHDVFDSETRLFNPLGNDTKVAVTTTMARDSSPHILTNYNGRPRPGYLILRARRPDGDVSISEAALCTSAAPGYLPPVDLDEFGTCQDGATCPQNNNPIALARKECLKIYPSKGEPDFFLSLGTGISRSTQPLKRITDFSPVKDGFLPRLVRCFMRSMDGELAWTNFVESLPASVKSRYHRWNISLEGLPAIDDVSSMSKMKDLAFASTAKSEVIEDVMDAILASSFYFELDGVPVFHNRQYSCSGFIRSRFDLRPTRRRSGRLYFYRYLKKASSCFYVDGKAEQCVKRIPGSLGPYVKKVQFTVNDTNSVVDITFNREGRARRSLSGFPRSIDYFVKAQQLVAPFGCDDHEKPLPSLPRKRGRGSVDEPRPRRRLRSSWPDEL